MSNWQLGIDFGTSFTVVSVATAGRVEVVDVESDGRSRLPSAVFLTEDGDVLVGARAQHQAVFAPERFEPTPKRSIGEGELFLGDRLVPVADLVAGVFRRVYKETCRQRGETTPNAIYVTHPAEWAETRLQVLRSAAASAGLEHVTFVAEPVAAAARIAGANTEPGRQIAVYDFGGGTFDAAVLTRTPEAFAVAGPPAGRDPLGGEDIDRRIVDHVGSLLADEYPDEWKRLMNPSDVASRRDAADLRAEVQQAKETLSEVTACQLWVAGIGRGVQLTRGELDELIRDDIEATVDTLEQAITAAGTTPQALAGIYLVGGSSRIPLVADSIWRRLGVVPTAQDNPKSVVAMGAAAWGTAPEGGTHTTPAASSAPAEPVLSAVPAEPVPSAPHPVASSAPTDPASPAWQVPAGAHPTESTTPAPEPAARPARAPRTASSSSRLALVREPQGTAVEHFSAMLTVDQPGSGRITVQVWPAPPAATTAALAQETARRHAQQAPGFQEMALGPVGGFGHPDAIERRYIANGPRGPEIRVERYLVAGPYSLVASAPVEDSGDLDAIEELPSAFDPVASFAPAVRMEHRAGASVYERVQLTRAATQQVTATRLVLPSAPAAGAWLETQLASVVASRRGAVVVSRSTGPVIGDLPGEVAIVRTPGRGPLLAAIGVADADDGLYEITVWVPEKDKALLGSLAHRAAVQPISPS